MRLSSGPPSGSRPGGPVSADELGSREKPTVATRLQRGVVAVHRHRGDVGGHRALAARRGGASIGASVVMEIRQRSPVTRALGRLGASRALSDVPGSPSPHSPEPLPLNNADPQAQIPQRASQPAVAQADAALHPGARHVLVAFLWFALAHRPPRSSSAPRSPLLVGVGGAAPHARRLARHRRRRGRLRRPGRRQPPSRARAARAIPRPPLRDAVLRGAPRPRHHLLLERRLRPRLRREHRRCRERRPLVRRCRRPPARQREVEPRAARVAQGHSRSPRRRASLPAKTPGSYVPPPSAPPAPSACFPAAPPRASTAPARFESEERRERPGSACASGNNVIHAI